MSKIVPRGAGDQRIASVNAARVSNHRVVSNQQSRGDAITHVSSDRAAKNRAAVSRWRKSHPERHAAQQRAYRARQRGS